jgi:D-sedoheptulose 7-phosphate isomerase
MEDYIVKIFRDSCHTTESFVNDNLIRIVAVVEAVTAALKAGNKILLFGNGGSAADAQHLAAEFVNRFIIERPPLPAIALTTDTSVITSIGNDYDFSEIFSKQIRAVGKKGDIAWGMSTSGTSVNVVKALETAKKIGMVTVGLTGRDGGDISRIAYHALIVASTSTPHQEVHITVGHVICEMVDFKLFQRPTASKARLWPKKENGHSGSTKTQGKAGKTDPDGESQPPRKGIDGKIARRKRRLRKITTNICAAAELDNYRNAPSGRRPRDKIRERKPAQGHPAARR